MLNNSALKKTLDNHLFYNKELNFLIAFGGTSCSVVTLMVSTKANMTKAILLAMRMRVCQLCFGCASCNRTRCNVAAIDAGTIHSSFTSRIICIHTNVSLCAFVLPLSTNFAAEKATSRRHEAK